MIMDEILDNIKEWVDMKIDALASGNPQMALFAPRLKRGIYNMIQQHIGQIEPLMPFLTDEQGRVDIGTMKEELLDIYNGMPKGEYMLGAFKVITDKGSIVVNIPDGVLWSIIFGDLKSVKFGTKDVEDLIDLFRGGVRK